MIKEKDREQSEEKLIDAVGELIKEVVFEMDCPKYSVNSNRVGI